MNPTDPAWQATALGLAAALGGGLLIGLERERRKLTGAARGAAGIRSFALAAVGGGIAQALQQPLLVALGGLLVVLLSTLAALAPAALPTVLPSAAAGAVTALAAALLPWRRGAATAAATAPTAASHGPLRLREALAVSALLGAVAVGVAWAQRQFGSTGLLAGTALAALADAQSPVAALATLFGEGRIDAGILRDGVLVGVMANGLTRSITGFVAGGRGFGAAVTLSLMASTGAALAVAWAQGGPAGL